MRKILFILSLVFASTAFAIGDSVQQLNAEVVNILAPFQNDSTVARFIFDDIETDENHAIYVGLNAHYHKTGKTSALEMNINNFTYSYGDGKAPSTTFEGSLGFDPSRYLSQEEFNTYVANFSEAAQRFVDFFISLDQYGDAASWKDLVTSTTTDSDGNYTAINVLISVKIDLSKLPENIRSKNVMATDVMLDLELNFKKGMAISGYMISNPDFWGFDSDLPGLKEELDSLLAQDEYELAKIHNFIKDLDNLALQYLSQEQNASLLWGGFNLRHLFK